MYEESVSVPIILSGADIPKGKKVDTPVSLIDIFPTILQGAGVEITPAEPELPGRSLIDIANGLTPDRAIFSEYHALGSISSIFMIRIDNWKYVHYVDYPPQLFDLKLDPFEANDLAESTEHRGKLAECEAILRKFVDPEEVCKLAFADHRKIAAKHGGEAAILNRGSFAFTPIPNQDKIKSRALS